MTAPDAIALLRGGDILIKTMLDGAVEWRFSRSLLVCPTDVVGLLERGGPLLEPAGGRLVPLQDGLLPGRPWLSQTWAWAEGGLQ